MSHIFEIPATNRVKHGTSASRRLRNTDYIPAVVYGANKEPQSLSIEHRLIKKAVDTEGFSASIITLDIDGKKVKAVLKSIQRHPYKPKVMHADFLRISDSERITMHVPLRFIGGDVCPGVKLQSGIVSHHINEVNVSCLPGDLPDHIDVDISHLDTEKSLHLSDLVLPKGVQLTVNFTDNADHNIPVVGISIPRAAAAGDDNATASDSSGASDNEKKS